MKQRNRIRKNCTRERGGAEKIERVGLKDWRHGRSFGAWGRDMDIENFGTGKWWRRDREEQGGTERRKRERNRTL